MKKAIVIVVLFAILAITFTAAMINVKKLEQLSTNPTSNTSPTNKPVNTLEPISTKSQKDNKPKEKTVDLYSTYNENDLVIKEETINHSNDKVNEFIIPQISGLKNKAVEEKVNNDIKERANKIIDEKFASMPIDTMDVSYSKYDGASFSNVISICLIVSYTTNGAICTDYVGLNYELVNGNRLLAEDLFTQDTSIEDLLRICCYRISAEEKLQNEYITEMDYFDEEPFYNFELGIWQFKRTHSYWDSTLSEQYTREEILEFVPLYSDYEIEKLIRKGFNQDNFWFSSTRIYFEIGGNKIYTRTFYDGRQADYNDVKVSHLYFTDLADRLVIYDKYLTKDSLFENGNLGRKNIVTLSAESYTPLEKEAVFKSDNYFYDHIPFLRKYEYPSYYDYGNDLGSISMYTDKLLDNINSKMNEIIKEYEDISNNDKEHAYLLFVYPFEGNGRNTPNYYDKEYVDEVFFMTKLLKCNIKDKYKVMDDLFNDLYRYYNIGFYGSWLYEDVSYIDIPSDYHDFAVRVPNCSFEETYYYYSISTGEFLFKGNTPKRYKGDYTYYSKEWLNREYNEIFARHGHDFKSEDLKEYFNQQDWYNPIPNKVVSYDELSEIERQNADLLRELINEK